MSTDERYEIVRTETRLLVSGRWTGRCWVRRGADGAVEELVVAIPVDFLFEEDANDYARTLGIGAMMEESTDLAGWNELCRVYPDVVDGETDGTKWIARLSHVMNADYSPWSITIRGSDTTYLLAKFRSMPSADEVRHEAESWVRARR